jgi:hypothetical protein
MLTEESKGRNLRKPLRFRQAPGRLQAFGSACRAMEVMTVGDLEWFIAWSRRNVEETSEVSSMHDEDGMLSP